MERNLDKNLVVLHVDVYSHLLDHVERNDKRILKHANKFNPHLHNESEEYRKEKHRRYKAKLHEFREFMKLATGKVVRQFSPFTEKHGHEIKLVKVSKKNQEVMMLWKFKDDVKGRLRHSSTLVWLRISPKETE